MSPLASSVPALAEGPRLFRSEYRHELETWLRQRFRHLCLTFFIFAVIDTLVSVLLIQTVPTAASVIAIVGKLLNLGVAGVALFARDWSEATRPQILRATTRLILLLGSISILTNLAIRVIAPSAAPSLIIIIFLWHFSACLFLPWTPRESLRPFVPLLAMWALLVLLLPMNSGFVQRVLTVAFGPGVMLPGLAIAALRLQQHIQRFSSRMFGKQFLTMRHELVRARSIHESLFPAPYEDAAVRFDYMYTPMRELGGDFVHLHIGGEGLVHLSVVDVTGHGLAAALTVNRLSGELERIHAEHPRAEPGAVLALLNRYVQLTMTRHHIYATAACMTLDPYLGELRWASGGHPPAYIRRHTGGIDALPATTVLLGAVDDDEFDARTEGMAIAPGDTMIVFTDGVFEARDRANAQFGLDRLRALIARDPAPTDWPRVLTAAVARHDGGQHEDDILVAALHFLAPRTDLEPSTPVVVTGEPAG